MGSKRRERPRTARLVSLILIVAVAPALSPASASADTPSVAWVDQFGSSKSENGTWGLDVFDNEVFTGGHTSGVLPGQTSAGSSDAWIRSTNEHGTVRWTVQFGSRKWDNVEDVDANASGLYVVGGTWGNIGGPSDGGVDGYLAKFDLEGHELWATKLGTTEDDWAISVTAGSQGIYVYAQTWGAFPGYENRGDADIVIARFDLNGSFEWARQFGSRKHEEPWALEAGSHGIYVDGYTNGRLPGATHPGGWDAYLARLAPDGSVMWVRQFGSADADLGSGLAADAGGVYMSGQTFGSLPGSNLHGGSDAFVAHFSSTGSMTWSRQFGTRGYDGAGAAVLVGDKIVVVGHTDGVFAGQTALGSDDVFARAVGAADGRNRWTIQFGTSDWEDVGWAWGGSDRMFVIGDTAGAFPGQTNAGGVDTYLARIDVGPEVMAAHEFGGS
jgi:hypothetical protein